METKKAGKPIARPSQEVEARFWGRIKKTPGCWLWTGSTNRQGYGTLNIDKQYVLAHRVAWTLALGDIPRGKCVLHHCDTPACCRPIHLFLGDPKDNTTDMIAKNRQCQGERKSLIMRAAALRGDAHPSRTNPGYLPRGEKHWRAILTAEHVREIRRLRADRFTYEKIAATFSVSQGTIYDIIAGKTWRHVV
jgi:hypothetical protein